MRFGDGSGLVTTHEGGNVCFKVPEELIRDSIARSLGLKPDEHGHICLEQRCGTVGARLLLEAAIDDIKKAVVNELQTIATPPVETKRKTATVAS